MFGILRRFSGATPSAQRRSSNCNGNEGPPGSFKRHATKFANLAGALGIFGKKSKSKHGKHFSFQDRVPSQLRPGPRVPAEPLPSTVHRRESLIISVVAGFVELPGDIPLFSLNSCPYPVTQDQQPAHPDSTYPEEEEETFVMETSVWHSAWSPRNSRPHGLVQIADYQMKSAAKSKPNAPTGNSPDVKLPDPRTVLGPRYSWESNISRVSSLILDESPVGNATDDSPGEGGEASNREYPRFATVEDYEEVRPIPPAAAACSSTIDEPILTEASPLSPAGPVPVTSPRGPVSAYEPMRYMGIAPSQPSQSSRPNTTYTAFRPGVHVIVAVQHIEEGQLNSPTQVLMANELHFEHVEQPPRTPRSRGSWLMRNARSKPAPDFLGSSNVPDPAIDITSELNNILGKPASTSTTEDPASSSTKPHRIKRKPVPPRSNVNFVRKEDLPALSPTVTSPFSSDRYPLLDNANRSLESGLLALKAPLPMGHTSQNGSEPMIARARPVECRGRDGWLHREVDSAKEWFEETKGERLTRRRKEAEEWERRGDEEEGEEDEK